MQSAPIPPSLAGYSSRKQADAVFLTHRDPRDALLSSAQKISSCLAYGTQPLLSAFAHYASWYPHACHDMRYEDMIAGGAARTHSRTPAPGGSRPREVPTGDPPWRGSRRCRCRRSCSAAGS